MLKIAIIEDNLHEANELKKYILEYTQHHEQHWKQVSIDLFSSSENFFQSEEQTYDICFFDIELPNINGMEAAYKLRDLDKQTIIIFVTNLTQYAIKGYQVSALDYIIKPATYQNITVPLERALALAKYNSGLSLTISNANGITIVESKNILYIEVFDHRLTYHTTQGTISSSGSLSKLQVILADHHFMRCNACYLLNPKYIKSVTKKYVIMVDGSELKISKPKRKGFMEELTIWLGKGNVT